MVPTLFPPRRATLRDGALEFSPPSSREEDVWSLAQVPDPLYGPARKMGTLALYTLLPGVSFTWNGFYLAEPPLPDKGHLSCYSSQYPALQRQGRDRMRTAGSGVGRTSRTLFPAQPLRRFRIVLMPPCVLVTRLDGSDS